MKEEILKNFTKDINDIREYLKYIELVNDIQTSEVKDEPHLLLKNHLHKFGVTKKIFEYKSITISLYGILENHIGIWIKEYISHINNIISNYNDLSEKFKDLHFNLSIKLLGLISEKKHAKYENLDKEKVLEKLNSCIKTPYNFQLNSHAFYLQSGNLRHARISEIFNQLDININERLKTIGTRTPDGFLYGMSNVANRGNDLFRLIDDLVIRRNDVAHGENIDEIINITEFNEYIDFLEHYGKAIFQVLVEKINQLESEHFYHEINNILGRYKNGTVICFEIKNNKISVGDFIIVKHKDGSFIKNKILNIQIDKENIDRFSTIEPKNIGIKLNEKVLNNQTIFIKKSNI